MRIKIVSDGTISGTKVLDADTHESIAKVSHIEIEIGVNCPPTATITIVEPEIDIEANVRKDWRYPVYD